MWRPLRALADCIFPLHCAACGSVLPLLAETALCDVCRTGIPLPAPPLCGRCGLPLAHPGRCGPCARRPPAFRTARAVGLYLPADRGPTPLATAVQRLKYGRERRVAVALGHLMADRYPFGRRVLVVPVPLHTTRLRERGFNQALLLARALARRRGLPVATHVLVRHRRTTGQPGLDADGRRRNLRAAFRVRRPGTVRGRAIVLVDDVLTTGATADACARALLGAGARTVDVFTVGRTP